MLDFLKKVRDNIVNIASVIATVLIGLLIWESKRKDADKALQQDQDAQKKIDALSQDQKQNDAALQTEQDKRDAIEKQLQKDENEKPSQEELLQFFNKPDPNAPKQ